MTHTLRSVRRALSLSALALLMTSMTGCCIVGIGPCVDDTTPNAISSLSEVTITASEQAPKIFPGSAVDVRITASFVSTANKATLRLTTPLPPGVSARFSHDTVTRTAPNSTLTITAAPNAPTVQFFIDIAAQVPRVNPSDVIISLNVDLRSAFTLAVSGISTITSGTAQSLNIRVGRAPTFHAPVGLSVVPGTVPAGTGIVFSPATVDDSTGQLNLSIPAGTPAGRYLMRVAGTAGAYRDTITHALTIQDAPVPPDITLDITPAAATIVPGGNATFGIATTRNIGTLGMGPITLSFAGLPADATGALTPDNVAGASSKLVVTTAAKIADGTYPITITARVDTLVRTTTATLIVTTPPDFTLSVAPSTLTIARNANGSTKLSIQRTGAVGDVKISPDALPSGVTMTPGSATVAGADTSLTFSVSNSAVPGTYPIVLRGSGAGINRTVTLSLVVPAPPASNLSLQLLTPNVSVPAGGTVQIPIRLTRTGNAVGQVVELRLVGFPPGGHAWIAPSLTTGDSAMLNVIAGSAGVVNIAVSAVLGAFPPTEIATVTVTPSTTPDFAIVPAPQTFTMSTGSFVPISVEIWRRNGFTDAVTFDATGDIPSQYSFRFSSTQTTGPVIGMEILASSSVPAGPHTITIRGRSGGITREITMTIIVTSGPTYPYPYPYGVKAPPP